MCQFTYFSLMAFQLAPQLFIFIVYFYGLLSQSKVLLPYCFHFLGRILAHLMAPVLDIFVSRLCHFVLEPLKLEFVSFASFSDKSSEILHLKLEDFLWRKLKLGNFCQIIMHFEHWSKFIWISEKEIVYKGIQVLYGQRPYLFSLILQFKHAHFEFQISFLFNLDFPFDFLFAVGVQSF